MTLNLILLVSLAICTEISRETCFKIGSSKEHKLHFFAGVLINPIVWLGFLFWAAQTIIWLFVLQQAPITLVFPMMSLCYVGVVFVSKFFLKEEVTLIRWIGVIFITIGVAMIGNAGNI